MTSHEFKNLLDKYSRGQCTEEERNLILDWYSRIDRDPREGLKEEDHVKIIESRLWSKLKPARSSKLSNHYSSWRIAAAIVMACVIGPAVFIMHEKIFKDQAVAYNPDVVQPSSDISVITNNHSTPQQITLEDGSEVTLEPKSEIRYAKKFGLHKREVYLAGQAFFNVKRDTLRPFLVYSNEVITKVLGTSFTVSAYSNAKEVTVDVRSGKVSVYRRSESAETEEDTKREEVVLAPNQRAVYNRDIHHVSKQLVEKPQIILPEPTLVQMEYDGAPVVRIFEVLEENYGVDIVFDELVWTGCGLTTSMIEEGLYERIRIICEAIGAEYEVLGTSIIIKGKGCI